MTESRSEKIRLDLFVHEQGWAESRSKAQALILTGDVLVNDQPVTHAGYAVKPKDQVRLRLGSQQKYVSRGAYKLKAALEAFGISAAGKTGMDLGASTGGFTEVLLEAGATCVYAIDVGHNQLAWSLKTDPRVKSFEGINARHLKLEDLGTNAPRLFQIVVADLSFIGLAKVLTAAIAFSDQHTDFVTLIKPQFEAGPDQVGKGGIVTDPEVRKKVVEKVTLELEQLGLRRAGLIESPITGTDGNHEYLAWWRRKISDESN